MKKRELLVTIADDPFADAAKQVFSSAYFNGGWRGEMMVLTTGLGEANRQWFEARGIRVEVREPLFSVEEWNSRCAWSVPEVGKRHPLITTLKCYLFTEAFREWENIVYLDADTMVNGPLGPLANPRRFTAPPGRNKRLSTEFRDGGAFLPGGNADIGRYIFDSGVFSFPTSIIRPETFSELRKLFEQTLAYAQHPPRAVLNLHFGRDWNEISFVYGASVWFHILPFYPRGLRPNQFFGAVLHFSEQDGMPWMWNNPCYEAWRKNFARAAELGKVSLPANSPFYRLRFGQRLAILRVRIGLRRFLFSLRTKFGGLLSPASHLKKMIRKRLGKVSSQQEFADSILSQAQGRVSAGPFKGMVVSNVGVGSASTPKLLGTYEKELGPVVEELCAMPFEKIINVGAGDGFYAVGMAMKASCPVVAFEMDELGTRLIAEVAKANGVLDRISIHGACDPKGLNQMLGDFRSALVVMDVEGMEDSLLDPKTVPGLVGAHILVEIHDHVDRTLGQRILDRFRHSHSLREIWASDRTLSDFPLPLTPRQAKQLGPVVLQSMSEYRPEKMRWFYFEPRRAVARAS